MCISWVRLLAGAAFLCLCDKQLTLKSAVALDGYNLQVFSAIQV